MYKNFKFLFILLSLICHFSYCTKDDNSPPTQVLPELFDTLGPGWQRIKLDTTLNFTDIFFVNNLAGFLCGDKYLGKSTDGGLTWKKLLPDSLNESFLNLFFADAGNGWVAGAGFLLRTKDGGSGWQKAYKGDTYDIQFFDADNGYITRGLRGGLYKTADGGLTLQLVANGDAYGLFFRNQNKGWYCGTKLYKTENAGISFSSATEAFSGGAIQYTLQFTDDLHGWTAGSNVYRTNNGGTTLETLINKIMYGDIHFFDNNNGYILADGMIYSTADGGKTLNQLCAIHKSNLSEIHFTDAGHGWAAGTGGYVYRYVKP